MILKDVLTLIAFIVIVLPIGMWPIFLGIELHMSKPIIDCTKCLYGTGTGEWCRLNCKNGDRFIEKEPTNEQRKPY